MSRNRPTITILALTLLLGIALTWSAVAAPTLFKFGVSISDPANVFPGYVVFTGLDKIIYAVDITGSPVIRLKAPTDSTFGYARPIANGNILSLLNDGITGDRSMVEITQNGTVVWRYDPEVGTSLHHDQERMENGNTFMLCSKELLVPEVSTQEIIDDCLIEVNPAGEIVWEWQTADHFADFEFSNQVRGMIDAEGGDWAHANAAALIPSNTSHTDPRFAPGNIIISYRFINSIVIVDRNTGDIVWRTDGLTIGQHNSHMLTDDQVGAGNILVFDNGLGGLYNIGGNEIWNAESRVVEIDPTDTSIAWEYNANDSGQVKSSFNSWFISSAQRLPNGNTLIDEGSFGRIFEVTPDGTNVWEFISPAIGDFQGQDNNRVYRAEKVGLDWLE